MEGDRGDILQSAQAPRRTYLSNSLGGQDSQHRIALFADSADIIHLSDLQLGSLLTRETEICAPDDIAICAVKSKQLAFGRRCYEQLLQAELVAVQLAGDQGADCRGGVGAGVQAVGERCQVVGQGLCISILDLILLSPTAWKRYDSPVAH